MMNAIIRAIPALGLFSYSFLFLTLLPAKKGKIINAFLGILVASILWTGGSMSMRSLFPPGVAFWFQISIIGLFGLPYAFYRFIHAFVGEKGYLAKNIFRLVTLGIILLNLFGIFLAAPALSFDGAGQPLFTYTMSWTIIIPTVFTLAVVLCMLRMIAREVQKNQLYDGRLNPIIAGMIILLLGNLANLIPGVSSTSFDVLSGILNAVLIFYALYRRRLFNLTLLASRGTTYVMATAVMAIFFAKFITPYEEFIQGSFQALAPFSTLIIAVTFTLGVIFLYVLMKKIFDHLFLKDEVVKGGILKRFSMDISKTLELEEILPALTEALEKGVGVRGAYVAMEDPEGGAFRVHHSQSPLDARNFLLQRSSPFTQWMAEKKAPLLLQDFRKTTRYKGMWEKEKKQIAAYGIECMVPIMGDQKIIGILLLTEKRGKGSFTFDDLDFLESVSHIVSIAIKNAMMYRQAYLEARTDELTGLLNRKYLFRSLEEAFQRHKGDSIVLILLNLDDFKLYNQLYGTQEGDEALKKVAGILQAAAGKRGIVGRYSGKEFAIILPGQDVLAATLMADEIRNQVASMHKGEANEALKVLTFSGGICAYPYGASSQKELLENTEMTVFNVKRSGKNRVEVYALKEPEYQKETRQGKVNTEVYKEYASVIYALTAAVDTKDHYTFDHSQNVAEYATLLGEAIGLNDEHVEIIREAGLLHDIGKIGIPEHILNKQADLTDEEYEIMKTHVENSISMIRHLPSLDYVIPAVLGHHERWDGRGYPLGSKGEAIPLAARCLAVADAFDAMTTKRSYKVPLPVDYALSEIRRNAGRQFDPHLSQVFISLVEEGRIRV